MKKLIIKILLLGLVFAANAANNSSVRATIIGQLKLSLPELKIDQVSPSQIPNVYEVVSGHKVFYVDETGRYAMLGNLVDLRTKKSLTQEKVEQLSKVDWSKLPIRIAMRRVIGNGSRKIAIFTDPQCPFCKRFESETIPALKDVTIYYFLFPLPIHEYAETYSKQILCSETPIKAFTDWMRDGKALPTKTVCDNVNVLQKMIDVGNNVVQVDATPTIVLPDGSIVTGLVPADYLNKLINDVAPDTESNTPIKSAASAPQVVIQPKSN